jgi:cold-inducible RNA-binding protein
MKLYVGNIAPAATEQELQDLFAQHGAVLSARIMKDKFSGEPRGFGFVEMDSAQAGQAAIDGLNDYNLQGQRLRVSEARPQERSGGFGGNRGGGNGGSRGGFGGGNGGSRGGFGGNRGGY